MILVTGATGTIGSTILRRLSETGVSTRALSRDPRRGQDLPHVTWVQGDLSELASLTGAFDGVHRLFLLTANTPNMVELQTNAIDAAVAAGVDHVVKLSARGAQPTSKSAIGRWHHEAEAYLKDTDLAWTMLRPHVFMQNLLGQAERIRADGEIRAASGDGFIPFIDTRDIADVAVATLTEEGHAGQTYVLTGGTALHYDQVAATIGAAIGHEVRYVSESFDEARERMRDEGVPEWLIDSKLALAEYHRAGGSTADVATDVFALTAHAPRSMAQFAYDHRSQFIARGE